VFSQKTRDRRPCPQSVYSSATGEDAKYGAQRQTRLASCCLDHLGRVGISDGRRSRDVADEDEEEGEGEVCGCYGQNSQRQDSQLNGVGLGSRAPP
jgi:hypothetical protein